jgi:hypothetical protein
MQFASHFSLDKLCEVWYNGNFGASSNVGAPRKLSNRRIESVDNFEFLFVNLAFPDGFLSRMLCH